MAATAFFEMQINDVNEPNENRRHSQTRVNRIGAIDMTCAALSHC